MSRILKAAWALESLLRSFEKKMGRRAAYLEASIMMLALVLAFMIRVLPARWGFLLSEFDPWWHFKAANFIIERGWAGFFEFAGWVDDKSWYPTGLLVGKTLFPGVSFTMAGIYLTFSSFGIYLDPLELAAMLPVFYGLITIIVIFIFTRYIIGTKAALASSIFMAISNAHISRTHLGWFDDESLSIPLMLAGYVAYLAAINEKRSYAGAAGLGLLAGLLLGYMTATWGAHKFPLIFIAFYTAMITFIGRYQSKMLVAYIPTVITYTIIAINVPKLGLGYLREITMISGLVVIGYLAVAEISNRLMNHERQVMLVRGIAIASVAALLVLASLGAADLPSLKFLSVIMPWLRGALPIVISVAENQTSTWLSLFNDFGPLLLLTPYGVYMLYRKRTNEAIFLLLYSIFAFYFAASLVRLVLLTSPAVAILAGYTFSHMLESAGRSIASQRMVMQRAPRAAMIVPLTFIAILALYYQPTGLGGGLGISPIDAGATPATIVSSSIPARQAIPDWLRAVEWMRNNLPPNAVVASWWDYGNWITVLGNRTSIIDNTTIDSRRIAKVAYAFMSPVDESYKIFRDLGATHVLIFVTHRPQLGQADVPVFLGFGEESKWVWMLRIANQEADVLGIEPLNEGDYHGGDPTNPTDKFWSDTTIGALIPFKPRNVGGRTGYFYEEPQLEHYKLVFSSSRPYESLAYVYIYEIVP